MYINMLVNNMWGVVEQVIGEYIYVIFEDESRKKCINIHNFKIVENNQVLVKDNIIMEVKGYDEKLYLEIKELEEKTFKKKK